MDSNDKNEQGQPEEVVMVRIVMKKDGSLSIDGLSLTDRTLAYGLLETAKDMIREMHTPKIVKPTGGMINFARNGVRNGH